MKLGVALPFIDVAVGSDPAAIREFAQTAGEIGYQDLAAPDHVLGVNSEALGAGQDVLCMHTVGADTTRLISAGSGPCVRVTIGRQDRDEPATNIVAANQLSRC